jgi:hypothetical protein
MDMRDAIRRAAAVLVLCLLSLPAVAWSCDEKPVEQPPLEVPTVRTLKDWDGKDPYPQEVAYPATVVTKLETGELLVYGVDPDKDRLVFIYRLASEAELGKLTGDKPRGGITLLGLSTASQGLILRPVPDPTPPGEPDPLSRMSKALALVQSVLAQLGKLP